MDAPKTCAPDYKERRRIKELESQLGTQAHALETAKRDRDMIGRAIAPWSEAKVQDVSTETLISWATQNYQDAINLRVKLETQTQALKEAEEKLFAANACIDMYKNVMPGITLGDLVSIKETREERNSLRSQLDEQLRLRVSARPESVLLQEEIAKNHNLRKQLAEYQERHADYAKQATALEVANEEIQRLKAELYNFKAMRKKQGTTKKWRLWSYL